MYVQNTVRSVCVCVLANVLNIQSCFYFYSSVSHCSERSECPCLRHPEGCFSHEMEFSSFHNVIQPE